QQDRPRSGHGGDFPARSAGHAAKAPRSRSRRSRMAGAPAAPRPRQLDRDRIRGSMMASKREQVLQALFDRLSGVAGPKILRNEVLPERIPAGGVVILRDGDPGEPDVLLSPPEYVYAHRADIEVVADGPTPAARDGIFDSIML